MSITKQIQNLAKQRAISFSEAARILGQRKKSKLSRKRQHEENMRRFEQMKAQRPDLYD